MAWNQQKDLDDAKKQAKDWETKAAASEQRAKDLETQMQKLQADRAAERKQVEAMNNEFTQLKAALETKEKNKEQKPAEKPDFDLDPEAAVNTTIRPVAEIAIKNAVMTARILAQQSLDNEDANSDGKKMDGRLFRAWGDQIDAEAKKYPATALTTPDTWRGLFFYVKGLHSDELSNPDIRKEKFPFLESGRGGTPPPAGEEKKVDKLTPDEIRVCERMEVTQEEYLKQKKALRFAAA